MLGCGIAVLVLPVRGGTSKRRWRRWRRTPGWPLITLGGARSLRQRRESRQIAIGADPIRYSGGWIRSRLLVVSHYGASGGDMARHGGCAPHRLRRWFGVSAELVEPSAAVVHRVVLLAVVREDGTFPTQRGGIAAHGPSRCGALPALTGMPGGLPTTGVSPAARKPSLLPAATAATRPRGSANAAHLGGSAPALLGTISLMYGHGAHHPAHCLHRPQIVAHLALLLLLLLLQRLLGIDIL
mmetsp:Transcript_33469/g.61476  ORF Transcript_33469/g.61476 Transcript_33469/m.61476 type:complete len:241 (+) Transcript_33469:162-884(+)